MVPGFILQFERGYVMAKQYEKIRQFMQTNPAVAPQMRKYAAALDVSIDWPDTTTTTTTTTVTTTTTTT